MTKRIVSGVFLLVALGALGLILAGALTSGEQLIVRFLTAIVVAALCLYVISDLRLQADDGEAAARSSRKPSAEGNRRRGAAAPSLPPNSTAAFMATVTGKRSATNLPDDEHEGLEGQAADQIEEVAPLAASDADAANDTPIADVAETTSAYAAEAIEAESWPHNTLGHADEAPAAEHDDAEVDEELEELMAELTEEPELVEEPASEGLVAIFSKQADRATSLPDLEVEQHALAVNDHYRPRPLPTFAAPNLTSITGGALATESSEPAPDSPHAAPLDADPSGHAADDELIADDAGADSTTEDDTTEDDAAWLDETDGVLELDLELDNDDRLAVLGDPHANPEPVAESARDQDATDQDSTDQVSTAPGGASEERADADRADEHRAEPTAPSTLDELATYAPPQHRARKAAPAGETASDEAPSDDTARSEPSTDVLPAVAIAADAHTTPAVPKETTPPPAITGSAALEAMPGLDAAAYARARVIDLLVGKGEPTDRGIAEIDAAIQAGEVEIISSLIEDGTLSSNGAISDKDVRTMVFVAFTSNELRKILRSGGRLDGVGEDLDLGPVEVFRADDSAEQAALPTADEPTPSSTSTAKAKASSGREAILAAAKLADDDRERPEPVTAS